MTGNLRQPFTNLEYKGNRGPDILPKPNQREMFFRLKETGVLPLAKPMKVEYAKEGRNGGYYEYHRNYYHTMKQCMQLARAIIQVTNEKREEPPKPPRVNQELLIQRSGENEGKMGEDIIETIFVIMDEEENEVRESRKRTHVNWTLSFSEKEFKSHIRAYW